jgi:hypothetical protein
MKLADLKAALETKTEEILSLIYSNIPSKGDTEDECQRHYLVNCLNKFNHAINGIEQADLTPSGHPKEFYIQHNIGKAKYVVNYHDGVELHPDSSPFYGISTFNNKKDLNDYIKALIKYGYSKSSQ